jgi:predicted ArsR family transcriptional regulator
MIDLEKKLNISRGSLRHHLNVLEKEGKIDPMQRDDTQQGRPTEIKLSENYKKKLKQENESLTGEVIIALNELISSDGIMKKDDFIQINEGASRLLFTIEPKMIEQYIKITPNGKQFLKENDKK